MPTRTSWIVPDHVFLVTLSGSVTLEELTTLRSEIQVALGSATKLHYLVDLRTLQDIQDVEGLRHVLGKSGPLRHRKTGRIAVIGTTEAGSLTLKSVTNALHITMGMFDDEEGALNFLAEADM